MRSECGRILRKEDESEGAQEKKKRKEEKTSVGIKSRLSGGCGEAVHHQGEVPSIMRLLVKEQPLWIKQQKHSTKTPTAHKEQKSRERAGGKQ